MLPTWGHQHFISHLVIDRNYPFHGLNFLGNHFATWRAQLSCPCPYPHPHLCACTQWFEILDCLSTTCPRNLYISCNSHFSSLLYVMRFHQYAKFLLQFHFPFSILCHLIWNHHFIYIISFQELQSPKVAIFISPLFIMYYSLCIKKIYPSW